MKSLHQALTKTLYFLAKNDELIRPVGRFLWEIIKMVGIQHKACRVNSFLAPKSGNAVNKKIKFFSYINLGNVNTTQENDMLKDFNRIRHFVLWMCLN